jgi:hypothetical protein
MTTPADSMICSLEGIAMIDRSVVEALLYRVAYAALDHYPAKPVDEPGYTIDEDLDWCLQALDLPGKELDGLRERIRAVITDPTGHRQQFVRDLNALIGD